MAMQTIEKNLETWAEIPKFNWKVAVIWSGGREHKLAKQLLASESTSKVCVLPWNAGTDLEDGIRNVNIKVDEIDKILDYIEENNIGLTVVWPEDPLANGIVDAFYDRWLDKLGLSIFWPTKAAAQLESSKGFTKNICKKKDIPTAKWDSFTDVEKAMGYIEDLGYPIVLKADWLAAGKGVIIDYNENDARKTLEDMLSWNSFWDAGDSVLVEEFLEGEEVSMIFMVDESGTIVPMISSQDHKKVWVWDSWKNTWWMWAISPASHIMTPELTEKVIRDVIQPTVDEMKENGEAFSGFLYAGLMVTEDKQTKEKIPNLIEYNVRFGDPETQAVLAQFPEWKDFSKMCHAAANNNLASIDNIKELQQSTKFAVTTVLCAVWYPEKEYKKRYTINLPEVSEEDKEEYGVEYIHAGTQLDEDWNIIGTWWRVMSITALAGSVEEAVKITNKYAEKIVEWSRDDEGKDNLFYREDIGYRAIKAAKVV